MCDCKILINGLWEDSVGTFKNSQKCLATEVINSKPVYMYTSRIHVQLPMESYRKIYGEWRLQQPNVARERMKLKTGIFRVMGGSEQSLHVCHLGEGLGQLRTCMDIF